MKTKIMQCLFLLVGTMTLLTSCHKDDDVEPAPTPEVTKPTTYTIMLYGCGGGDLNEALDYNLSQIDKYGKTDRINFTGIVKFSKDRQDDAAKEGTRLFTLTNEGLKNEKVHEASYRMDNPAHLAQFIKDTKEKMPADKYILVFWGYGQEFGLSDKLSSDADYTEQTGSRSVLFDDNVGNESLSVYEIEKGIKASDTKMDLIYMDVSTYGMAEVNYQLKDCAKYLMTSSSYTPNVSGDYSELLEDLQANDSLEDAIKEYVPNCVKNWKESNLEGKQADLECYDLSYMDEFASYLKGAASEFKNMVKDTREQQKELDAAYDGVVCAANYGKFMGQTDELNVFDANNVSVDVCSAFSRIARYTMNGAMSHYATQMKHTLDKMLVAHASWNIPAWMENVSMGLLWPTNSFVAYLDNFDKTQAEIVANNLKNAALYQATGWGELLANLNNPLTCKITSPLGNDIYIENDYHYRRNHTWQYDLEFVELDKLLDEEDIQVLKDRCKEELDDLNSKAEEYPVGLYLGKFVFDELKDELIGDDPSESFFAIWGVHKLKLKAYVKDKVESYETEDGKFPTEIVEVIDLDDDASNNK